MRYVSCAFRRVPLAWAAPLPPTQQYTPFRFLYCWSLFKTHSKGGSREEYSTRAVVYVLSFRRHTRARTYTHTYTYTDPSVIHTSVHLPP